MVLDAGRGDPQGRRPFRPDRHEEVLSEAKALDELFFIEVKGAIGSRADLGRPTTTAKENKENFMEHLG